MSDPKICARCAATGPTCCTLTPGHEEFCFPLSEIERHRILETRAGKGVFARERNTSAFLDNLLKLFIGEQARLEELFPAHGEHYRLATGADGRCMLLGPAGCTLPREARPYYCRIFPLWPDRGEVRVFSLGRCLARQEARGLAAIMRLLGETHPHLNHLHGRLRLAWGFLPRVGDAPPLDIPNRKNS